MKRLLLCGQHSTRGPLQGGMATVQTILASARGGRSGLWPPAPARGLRCAPPQRGARAEPSTATANCLLPRVGALPGRSTSATSLPGSPPRTLDASGASSSEGSITSALFQGPVGPASA